MLRQPQMIEPIKSSMVLEKSLSLISLLLFSCYIGWVVSAIELVKVFNGVDLGMDKKVLAMQISNALVPYLSYSFYALPGWICAMLILIFSKYRARFFLYFWSLSSVVLVLGFPFGSLFGLILGIVVFIKRKQFT